MKVSTARSEAVAFLEFHRTGGAPAPDSPWEVVQDAVDRDQRRAWRIILWAVAIARDDRDLTFIGTGPLETLLVHHPQYFERAIGLARRHESFSAALRSADIRGGPDEHVARLDAFFDDLEGQK
jgi:hypothetical protein